MTPQRLHQKTLTLLFLLILPLNGHAMQMLTASDLSWLTAAQVRLTRELIDRHGDGVSERAGRGVRQVAALWRSEDGDEAAFGSFVTTHFLSDPSSVDSMVARFETLLEQYDGHMTEIARAFRSQTDLDAGLVQPYDEMFAGYDPSAHALEDFFRNKLAFVVLLNLPLTTLQERLAEGPSWTRTQWAQARLAQRFGRRVPAEVNLEIAKAASAANQYIAGYNIWMHHVLDEHGERLFPPGLRLLSHWNLRDEIKANYAAGERGHAKQKVLQKVMERIATQTIPAAVVNNPAVDWDPSANTVAPAAVQDAQSDAQPAGQPSAEREPDTRYAVLLNTYRAARLADPYSPAAPTLIARRFDEDREIPEPRVRAILESVIGSPLLPRVAALIRNRLGRPLEPFDIWYNGFRTQSAYSEQYLDSVVRARYPDPAAFQRDIPRILVSLGFPPARAEAIAQFIVVDPARGSGHAWGSAMRSAPVRLRTRVGSAGMDYKGYSIAVHELGHNVEQVISLHDIDHWVLRGVPNTAFTEAIAFVFQARDQFLLGLSAPDREADALQVLNEFWATCEIAGVALVDMAVWQWMYDHPDATAAQLKDAVLEIARDVWNRYYAPVFGVRNVELLAVYSHMIHSFLYLPDYPLGHLIAHQLSEELRTEGTIGTAIDRMARIGSLVPDLWMKDATGTTVGSEAMLAAVERALRGLKGGK